jgi:Flp pilus assembly protein TadD
MAYERADQWPKAEADLQEALKLIPADPTTPLDRRDRAQVLNYLGYSWVNKSMNIPQAFDMLKKAVELAPTDGYIADSLGWAYYRQNRFEDAVLQLEHAIEMRPADPTINDHLGDAYWRVGRKLEAQFQWNHARDMKPEPEELAIILDKIEHGLKDEPATTVAEPKKGDGG